MLGYVQSLRFSFGLIFVQILGAILKYLSERNYGILASGLVGGASAAL